jgi:HNH endonuclease
MKIINLNDINIYDIGNTIQIAGVVWAGRDVAFIAEIPGKSNEFQNLNKMPLTLEEWIKLNKQADLVETEIFSQDTTGITKIILRKTQRQLDGYLQWACWGRDNYTCRYCGRKNTEKNPVPLTIDHAPVPWEQKGPTILINLITACRPCNKEKGRMEYKEWLESPYYKKVSQNLSEEIRKMNQEKFNDIASINTQLVTNVRSR